MERIKELRWPRGRKDPVAFVILPAGYSLVENTNKDWTKARKTLSILPVLVSEGAKRKKKRKLDSKYKWKKDTLAY